jgi:hypothetical protein
MPWWRPVCGHRRRECHRICALPPAIIPLGRAQAVIPRAVEIPPERLTERREGWRLLQEFLHFPYSALGMAVRLVVVCRQNLMPKTEPNSSTIFATTPRASCSVQTVLYPTDTTAALAPMFGKSMTPNLCRSCQLSKTSSRIDNDTRATTSIDFP